MKTIIISAGHTPTGFQKDPGAVNTQLKLTEAELADELADKVKAVLVSRGQTQVLRDADSLRLNGVIAWAKRLITGRDIAVDIHFNAATATATGTEVLIGNVSTEVERNLAANISAGISTVLGIKNRGVKNESQSARGRLGWFTLPCETVLIEVCFISNPKEISNYLKKVDNVADVIARSILMHA